MTETEQFEQMKKNILRVSWSVNDSAYDGFSSETWSGINFAVKQILEGTGLTMKDLREEAEKKHWHD